MTPKPDKTAFCLAVLLCSLFTQCRFCFGVTVAPAETVVLNETRQLFLDDYLIASQENITRKMHPAVKHPDNPVVRPDQPWEGNCVLLFGSVICEGDKYRMWYLGGGGLAYAESTDGLNWVKPVFDFVKKDGRKTNVLVKMRYTAEINKQALAEYKAGVPNTIPFFREFHGVHKDSLEADPSRRYKMTYTCIDYRKKPKYRGLGIAFSDDGIGWKFFKNFVSESTNDISHLMFDKTRNKWVLYGRTKYHSPKVLKAWGDNEHFKKHNYGRAVTRIESSDLIEWNYTNWQESPITMVADTNDPLGTEIYSMQVFKYESVYIGLVQMFYNRPNDTLLEFQLAVSRDGVNFERICNRRPFIPCGSVGQWDRFNNAIADNPPIEMGDELWFYYSGRAYRHNPYKGADSGDKIRTRGAIGIATIKRDRFVSLGASFNGGTIVTKPVKITGKTLHLNAKADFGEIIVEVLDKNGKVIAKSKLLSKDSLDIGVEWDSGDLNVINEPVSLRITLRNALLFALWCI